MYLFYLEVQKYAMLLEWSGNIVFNQGGRYVFFHMRNRWSLVTISEILRKKPIPLTLMNEYERRQAICMIKLVNIQYTYSFTANAS